MSGMMSREEASDLDRTGARPNAGRRGRIVTAMALVAVAGAGIWTILDTRRSDLHRTGNPSLLTQERPFPAEGRYPSDPYIGALACEECHPGPFALQTRSGHSRTLRSAGSLSLARTLDGTRIADPEHPLVSWVFRYHDGRLQVSHTEQGRVEEAIVEYAFGSGRHATTFVNILDPEQPTILEHRLTSYAKGRSLGLTPGQDGMPRPPGGSPIGRMFTADEALKCFGCHTTQTSGRTDRAIDEATMIPNVSCERCHGPGRAHVEAARRGAPEAELTLPFGPGRYTAEALLTFCGTCHRHPSGSHPGQIRPDNPMLARFQPVGILQSRCYRESGGTLSCVTCHDPHARPSTDRASYVATCVSCHSTSNPGSSSRRPEAHRQPPDKPLVIGVPCPVQPRGDCIGCHMPRVDAGQNVLFADHWIRVRRPGE